MAEELLALLVAHAAVDEHQAVALLDQEGAKGPVAAVALIGGWFLVQSGFGTTPNMAPPSNLNGPWVTVWIVMPERYGAPASWAVFSSFERFAFDVRFRPPPRRQSS